VALLGEIAATAPADHSLGAIDAAEVRMYLEKFVFEMSEEVEEGLKEFLRYAFYHGILPDVADLHYLDPSSTDDED
jgi:predicted solute-binding protein